MTAPKVIAKPATAAVNAFLQDLGDMDSGQRVRAAALRAVAEKLDQASASRTGAIALAVGSLTKELTRLQDEMSAPGQTRETSEAIKGIFDD